MHKINNLQHDFAAINQRMLCLLLNIISMALVFVNTHASSDFLRQRQVLPVALQTAERRPGPGAGVPLQVGASGHAAAHGCGRRLWRGGGRRDGDPGGVRDGGALSVTAVPHHGQLRLLEPALLHALDLGRAGLGQSLDGLVLVLLGFLGGLQASFAGALLAFLHHLGRQLLLFVSHGQLQ